MKCALAFIAIVNYKQKSPHVSFLPRMDCVFSLVQVLVAGFRRDVGTQLQ